MVGLKSVVPLRVYPSVLLDLPRFLTNFLGSYDGGKVVERSLELKQPIIYVSINYR